MTPESRAAFQRLIAVDGLGAFRGDSLLKFWTRACARVERELRLEYGDPSFRLPHINIKTLRHSFGTKVYQDTKGDVNTVGRMLTHAPGSPMPYRYALGAVPEVLRDQMRQFAATARRKRGAAPVPSIRRVK